MATKSPPRKAPAAKKTPAKKSSTPRTTAKKAAPKKTAPRKPRTTKEVVPEQSSAARLISRHAADVWGVFFVAAGLVCALAIYLGGAGPVGGAISAGFGRIFGVVRVFVPPAFLLLGFTLILGPNRKSRTESEAPADQRDEMVRLAIGGVLLAVAATGLLHITRGHPRWGDPGIAFADAGGYTGYLSGGPLHAALGSLAGSLVLIAIGLVGIVMITQVSIRRWFKRSATLVAPVRGFGSSIWRALLGPGAAATEYEEVEVDEGAFAAPEVLVTSRANADDAELSEELNAGVKVAGSTDATNSNSENTTAFFDQFDGTSGDPLLHGVKPLFDPEPEVEVPTPVIPVAAPAPRPVPKVMVAKADPPAEKSAADMAPRRRKGSKWELPPLSMLESSLDQDIDSSIVAEAGQTLEKALAAHGVETRLVGMVVGPTVTRYELELGEGVKVARVTNLSKDIAYAMASPDVRILAPIPGRQAIGVEVPNKERQIVALGDLLRSKEATKRKDPLAVPLGRDINGKAQMMDLAKMPHVLIAGATGSGKSSCINTIITSVLMRATPDDVRMILVDPKMVEMTQYERVPHLLTQPVTDPKKAANALAWACREMDRRYELLSGVGYRDIGGYNAAFDEKKLPQVDPTDPNAKEYPRLPLILVVVDELADLMMVAARDVEDSILRIAQKARAIGIHLVIATQRPSTNVITGVIKANIPAKIAFSVSNMTDSRVILDQPGAERLIGRGDMLMLSPTSSAAERIQGCWVTEEEVQGVVALWRAQEDDAIESMGAPITSESVAPNGGAYTPPMLDEGPGGGLAAPAVPAAAESLASFDSPAGLADPLPSPGAPSALTPSALTPSALTPSAPSAMPQGAGSMDEIDPITSVPAAMAGASSDDDEMLPQAMELVVTSQLGSTSMLQRKLRVGFARAGRIMDELEEKGIVGPSHGSKAREVLITPEQLPQVMG